MQGKPSAEARPATDSAEAGAATPLGDARHHYWLALEMSRTVGLDLQAELEAGRIAHADWAEMVTRCRSCEWASGCPDWMARMREAGETPPPPPACVNASRFEALAAEPASRRAGTDGAP